MSDEPKDRGGRKHRDAEARIAELEARNGALRAALKRASGELVTHGALTPELRGITEAALSPGPAGPLAERIERLESILDAAVEVLRASEDEVLVYEEMLRAEVAIFRSREKGDEARGLRPKGPGAAS